VETASVVRPSRDGLRFYVLVAWAAATPALASAQAVEERHFLDMAEAADRSSARSDGDAQGSLGTARMRSANRVASEILRRRMAMSRSDDLELLDRARRAEVIVVRGDYDRIQDVLAALEIEHVVIPPRLLSTLTLMSTQILALNCPGRASDEAVRRISRFAGSGGYLIATDWALRTVARAFPETIRRGGRDTGNDVVSVTPIADHAFLEHVHATDDELEWWLEASSHPVRVLDPRRVEVLIASDEMEDKYGEEAIAVTFAAGDGRVLHTTSHFYLQQTRARTERQRARASEFARDLGLGEDDLDALRRDGLDDVRVGEVAGAFAMQQMITNVIVEKRRANDALLSTFRLRAARADVLRASPAADAESLGEVQEGFLLRELERDGSWVRVRDLFAREGWLDEAALVFPPEPIVEPAAALAPEAPAQSPIETPIEVTVLADPGVRSGCDTSGTTDLSLVLIALAGVFRRRR
jgi:hypothetical protein